MILASELFAIQQEIEAIQEDLGGLIVYWMSDDRTPVGHTAVLVRIEEVQPPTISSQGIYQLILATIYYQLTVSSNAESSDYQLREPLMLRGDQEIGVRGPYDFSKSALAGPS